MLDSGDDLATRVSRLERQNRWLRLITAVAATTLFMLVLMGQAGDLGLSKSKRISAEEFVLVDGSGKLLASLGPSYGGAALTIGSSAGKPRVILGVHKAGDTEGAVLVLADEELRERIALSSTKLENSIAIFDQAREERVFLADDGKSRGITVSGGDGLPKVQLTGGAEGTGLMLFGPDRTVRGTLAMVDDSPALRLCGSDGRARTLLGISRDGTVWGMRDERGHTRATVAVEGDKGANMVLYDAEERIIWKAR
jgi:hypothetical protein